ncbi:MAG: hypothetical protein WDA68_10415 [Phycisphaerae bacterium]
MKKDFASHPDLQDAVYWIGARYEWTHGHNHAQQVYEVSVEFDPNSEIAERARISHARTNIKSLIMLMEHRQAKEMIDELLAGFNGRQIPCDELEWIAEMYERVDEVDTTQGMFEQIVRKCPSCSDSYIVAKAHLAKYELFSTIDSGNKVKIQTMLSQMGSELIPSNSSSELMICKTNGVDLYLNTMGQICYYRGCKLKHFGNTKKAIDYFAASISFWERVFTEFPQSSLAPMACFSAASQSAQELADYAKAAEYSQKVVDDWPNYEESPFAQMKTAQYLGKMIEEGLLPVEQTMLAIMDCYRNVVEKYPSSNQAKHAASILEKYKKQ